MTEILTMIGFEDVTKVIALILGFISVCAIIVSLVTEGLKSIKQINSLPNKACVLCGSGYPHNTDDDRTHGVYENTCGVVHGICFFPGIVCGCEGKHVRVG